MSLYVNFPLLFVLYVLYVDVWFRGLLLLLLLLLMMMMSSTSTDHENKEEKKEEKRNAQLNTNKKKKKKCKNTPKKVEVHVKLPILSCVLYMKVLINVFSPLLRPFFCRLCQ